MLYTIYKYNTMANYTQPGYDISENGYWKGTTTGPNRGWPNNYYCAETMRSIGIAFTNFFNELYAVRRNEFGEPIKKIRVPIKFGPRMKSFDFRKQLESGKEYYISYPNLAWRFDGMSFDAERFSGQYAERAFYNDTLDDLGFDYKMTERFWKDVQPVPYNINISMELKCDLMSDAMDVTEQICTRFTPENYLNIKEFWFFNKRRSIKLTLNGDPGWQIESESMGEEDKREITVSFNFQVAAYLYKPIKDAVIIDKINLYMNAAKSDEVWHEELKGNYSGSVKEKYDFEDLYNCKLSKASAISAVNYEYLINGEPYSGAPIDYSAASALGQEITWKTSFTYKPTDDWVFYPEGSRLIKEKIITWTAEDGYKENYTYYSIPCFGENPNGIKIETKTLWDSYGQPYSGYYTKEYETIHTDDLKKKEL